MYQKTVSQTPVNIFPQLALLGNFQFLSLARASNQIACVKNTVHHGNCYSNHSLASKMC